MVVEKPLATGSAKLMMSLKSKSLVVSPVPDAIDVDPVVKAVQVFKPSGDQYICPIGIELPPEAIFGADEVRFQEAPVMFKRTA